MKREYVYYVPVLNQLFILACKPPSPNHLPMYLHINGFPLTALKEFFFIGVF